MGPNPHDLYRLGHNRRMDVLICEDDPVARSVISDLVEDRGGRVLAAVVSTLDAMGFLERFTPEVVIIDLVLRHGNGAQLVEHVRRAHPGVHVVVFTANDALAHIQDPAVEVVDKPDFERLSQVIASAGERTGDVGGERRRPVRYVANTPRTTTDARAFYQLIADARPDDVLVRVDVEGDPAGVAQDLRSTLRSHDAVLQRTDQVVALLIGGGDDTVRALQARLERFFPALASRTTSTLAGIDPIDAFSRLTSG
jgi:CheY-like chemotaxis protein